MSYLDRIYKQNPWFEDTKKIEQDPHLESLAAEKYIWRERSFLDHEFADGVYALTGMRQIGKSTHLKLFTKRQLTHENRKNIFYFNFDFLNTKKEIIELLEEYFEKIADKQQRTYLLLDEITSIKDSILAIKYLVDSGFSNNVTYILSGSSSVNFKKTGEYLPGRRDQGKDFTFHPLSFREYLYLTRSEDIENFLDNFGGVSDIEHAYQRVKAKLDLRQEFDNYLVSGGIPKIINAHLTEPSIEPELFHAYLSWIKSETAKNDRSERFVKLILNRILSSLSSDLSYNSLAQDAGIGSHNTVYDYLNFLEDTFVIKQIYNFDFSQNKINWRKNKKIYLADPFIYWLVDTWVKAKPKQDFLSLKDDRLKSVLVENVVATDLAKLYKDELFFHRSNYEIDFIAGDRALEVKYQNKVSHAELKNITKFKGRKFVLSKNDLEVTRDLIILPVEYFLILAHLL